MYTLVTAIPLLSAVGLARSTSCASGVHVIVARASTEQPGTGIIGAVARDVQAEVSGSDIAAVDYPALLKPYVPSQTNGVAALTRMVQEYAGRCPHTRMVLMGYSQVRLLCDSPVIGGC